MAEINEITSIMKEQHIQAVLMNIHLYSLSFFKRCNKLFSVIFPVKITFMVFLIMMARKNNRHHYENMPMQYKGFSEAVKIENFQ